MKSLSPGSPPRVRGKVAHNGLENVRRGITPACAGKSLCRNMVEFWFTDHPRVCGEKSVWDTKNRLWLGSPPRVRGKAHLRSSCRRMRRITPACAGKRLQRGTTCALPWDHPRVCGEKRNSKLSARIQRGSPPRVRGKDLSITICTASSGITPACAGKSASWRHCEPVGKDHPRVCGEKSTESDHGVCKWGSPPRVRGKVHSMSQMARCPRITPACAGKSCNHEQFAFRNMDHPRVCGEKTKKIP